MFLKIFGYSSVVVLLSLVLSACGGEPSLNQGGCNPADTPTNITSFTVAGSRVEGTTDVIDDSDIFTVSWDLDTSCTYTYELFFSLDDTLNGSEISVATGQCGFGYSCSYEVDLECSFDPVAKTISCGSGDTNVTILLSVPTPANRYFILEAHNEMMDSDDMTSNQVRVDY